MPACSASLTSRRIRCTNLYIREVRVSSGECEKRAHTQPRAVLLRPALTRVITSLSNILRDVVHVRSAVLEYMT